MVGFPVVGVVLVEVVCTDGRTVRLMSRTSLSCLHLGSFAQSLHCTTTWPLVFFPRGIPLLLKTTGRVRLLAPGTVTEEGVCTWKKLALIGVTLNECGSPQAFTSCRLLLTVEFCCSVTT